MAISLDLVTGVLSFLFTLLIFSYLIGDNPLFRIAVYIFVGVSSGYIAAVAWWQVLWPRLGYPLVTAMLSGSLAEKILAILPLIGAVLIFMKISPRLAGMSRIVMAYMVGVGGGVLSKIHSILKEFFFFETFSPNTNNCFLLQSPPPPSPPPLHLAK